jgi:tetratricopeptide (TPR) repeat protein
VRASGGYRAPLARVTGAAASDQERGSTAAISHGQRGLRTPRVVTAPSCSVAEDFDEAQRAAREAHRLYVAVNDDHGSASSLIALAWFEVNKGRVEAGAIHARRALELARAAQDDFLVAEALAYLAATMSLSQGRALVDEAAAHCRSVSNLHRLTAMLSRVSYTAMVEGEYEAATQLLERAADHAQALGERVSLAVIRGNQGLAALSRVTQPPRLPPSRRKSRSRVSRCTHRSPPRASADWEVWPPFADRPTARRDCAAPSWNTRARCRHSTGAYTRTSLRRPAPRRISKPGQPLRRGPTNDAQRSNRLRTRRRWSPLADGRPI